MLAARDQENLVHGHQAAAAAKPLNQGLGQLLPKTPGNKVPKTPFKVPLNDENILGGLGGGKTGLKTVGKGNEHILRGGGRVQADKNAFITPMGPRPRAPLGLKTTNAKTKVYQTPVQALPENGSKKANQNSVSARKPKPKVLHAEMTKVGSPGKEIDLEEREIEYMPPRVKDIPDLPEDIPTFDFSMFQNGNATRGFMHYYMNKPDEDGLSPIDRWHLEQKDISERIDIESNAAMQRDLDNADSICLHFPECPGEECKDMPERRRKAEEKYQKTIARLDSKQADPKIVPAQKKPAMPKGPSSLVTSKKAPTATTQPQSAKALKPITAPGPNTRLPPTLVSSRKQAPVPTNPSPMRHTAALSSSKTTLGYSKGRAASANIRKTVLPKKDQAPGVPDASLAPAMYIKRHGNPSFGSDMWLRCRALGYFDEDEDKNTEEPRDVGRDWVQEEAEKDFELTF